MPINKLHMTLKFHVSSLNLSVNHKINSNFSYILVSKMLIEAVELCSNYVDKNCPALIICITLDFKIEILLVIASVFC